MTFVITKEQMKGIPKPTKKDLDNIMNVLTNIDIGFGEIQIVKEKSK
tara:strand:+ start:314 stop:454 length:141 start_codon:yes stop_codon:yes gene_type:complete